MFKAIWRYFKAFGALLTGGINGMRSSLNENRHVIAATFDEIKDDQVKAVRSMSDAVAAMIAAKERKVAKVSTLTGRVAENSEMRDGALAMIEELKGQYDLTDDASINKLKATEDYQEAAGAYESLSKEIEDDEHTLDELELAIVEDEAQLSNRLAQLGTMKDQIEKIKQEKHETIADVEAAKQERQINDMINGISDNDSGERLSEMRDMREKMKAQVTVGRKLAGTESASRKERFKKFAQKKKASSEFDNLLGIGKQAEASTKEGAATEQEATTQLPE
jgi:phage shock protein A